MARQVHLDCFSGIAGDMALGALLDAGADETWVRGQLSALGLPGWRLELRRTAKHSIVGCDVQVIVEHDHAHDHGHHHDHDHHHDHSHEHGHDDHDHDHGQDHDHAHRRYVDIVALLERAPLDQQVRRRALRVFDKIGRAEARLHGMRLDNVSFHEVGAIDSIVDIVGVCAALTQLAPERVSCSPLPLGRGFVRTRHGPMPLPAPATLEVLALADRPVPTYHAGIDGELVTPTGAAIAATLVDEFVQLPVMAVERVGFGVGDMDLRDRPNLLRVLVGHVTPVAAGVPSPVVAAPAGGWPAPTLGGGREPLVVVEANLDDMNPQHFEPLAERLFADGALDVWLVPAHMKKGRPAVVVGVLVRPEQLAQVERRLLTESTTLGVRSHQVSRLALARRTVEVDTAFGPVEIKLGVEGAQLLHAMPEFDSVRRAAARTGASFKDVHDAALAAALALRHA